MTRLSNFINSLNFRKKLIITYAIVAVISVVIVGGFFSVVTTKLAVEQMNIQCQNSVQNITGQVEKLISRINDISSELYFNETLLQIYETEYENVQQAYNDYSKIETVEQILHVTPEISKIKFYIDNPTVFENGQIMKITDKLLESESFKAARKRNGSITWRNEVNPINNATTLHLMRVIQSLDHRNIGYMDIELNYNYIYAIIKDEKFFTSLVLDNKEIFAQSANNNVVSFDSKDFISASDTLGISYNNVSVQKQDYRVAYNNFRIQRTDNLFSVSVVIPTQYFTQIADELSVKGVLICLLGLGISFICLYVFSLVFSKRINLLRNEMDFVVNGDFEEHNIIYGNDEIALLYRNLNSMRTSMKNLIKGIYDEKQIEEELRQKQRQIELKLLSSQINPHFLFNTLETIRMKAHCNDQKEIARAVKILSNIMRSKMELHDQPTKLKVELDIIRDYLEIQKFRFGDRINYSIHVAQEEACECYILPFLIQPIVENAFMHGLENKKNGGFISVEIAIIEHDLIVEVKDNGVGISDSLMLALYSSFADESDQLGIGLKNVNDRIKLYYGEQYGVSIKSEIEHGTTVTLKIDYS